MNEGALGLHHEEQMRWWVKMDETNIKVPFVATWPEGARERRGSALNLATSCFDMAVDVKGI